MSAEGRPLVELLREALGEHQYALSCIYRGHVELGDYDAHLADVAAQVVAEWLGEQRETVAEAVRLYEADFDSLMDTQLDGYADAALAALVTGIRGER